MGFANTSRSKVAQRLLVFIACFTALTEGAKQLTAIDPARDIATCLGFYCAALVLTASLESGVQIITRGLHQPQPSAG